MNDALEMIKQKVLNDPYMSNCDQEAQKRIVALIEAERARLENNLTHCQKTIHGNAICGVKLDCHLHDWRQKDLLHVEWARLRAAVEKMITENVFSYDENITTREKVAKTEAFEAVLKLLEETE